jgi:hypothetical protein
LTKDLVELSKYTNYIGFKCKENTLKRHKKVIKRRKVVLSLTKNKSPATQMLMTSRITWEAEKNLKSEILELKSYRMSLRKSKSLTLNSFQSKKNNEEK